MKRMLYITAFPPNHRSGGQTFSTNAIIDLSSKYVIDLIYFEYPKQEIINLPVNSVKIFKPTFKNCICLPQYFPLFTKRFSESILEYIKAISNQYNVIYFDFSQVAIYSKYIKHPMKIIRCHDIIAQKYMRSDKFLLPWVRWTEKQILFHANKIFVPSRKDRDLLKNEYNLEAFFTNEYIEKYVLQNPTENYFGFIMFGRWQRKENLDGLIWFISKVCPLLEANIVKSINIMGSGMSIEFRRNYLDPIGIEYLGYIANSYAEIEKRKAMIVPLFKGAGVKVKVIDSFVTGTPVIGTDIAFEGIPHVQDLVFQANTEKEFADLISNFYKNKNQSKNKQEKQREFVTLYDCQHLSDFI